MDIEPDVVPFSEIHHEPGPTSEDEEFCNNQVTNRSNTVDGNNNTEASTSTSTSSPKKRNQRGRRRLVPREVSDSNKNTSNKTTAKRKSTKTVAARPDSESDYDPGTQDETAGHNDDHAEPAVDLLDNNEVPTSHSSKKKKKVCRNKRKRRILQIKVTNSKKKNNSETSSNKRNTKRSAAPSCDVDSDHDAGIEEGEPTDDIFSESDDEFCQESADHPEPPPDLLESNDTRTLENMYGGKYYGKTADQWKKFTEAEKHAIKVEAQKKVWVGQGFASDPRTMMFPNALPYGPKLINAKDVSLFTELDFFLLFLPIEYIKETLLPATRAKYPDFNLTFEEILTFLGLVMAMNNLLFSERKLYWLKEPVGYLQAFNFGQYMSRTRFEQIISKLELSFDPDPSQQILDFTDAMNQHFLSVFSPDDTLCEDESMIKAFHHGMDGRTKIARKPRPVGVEMKVVCCAKSRIVCWIEIQSGKNRMRNMEFVEKFGATVACTLRLIKAWKGSGRVVVADSWFGSIKAVLAVMNLLGLFAVMLVKTAHKGYPKEMLSDLSIPQGKWKSVSCSINGQQVMATRFKDLQFKDFISTCRTKLRGDPRVKRNGTHVERPDVGSFFLKHADSIDVHNHYRTGGTGLEDVLKTKDFIMRQFTALIGFGACNGFLIAKYKSYKPEPIPCLVSDHANYKIRLSNLLINFSNKAINPRKFHLPIANSHNRNAAAEHNLAKYPDELDEDGNIVKRTQRDCFTCYQKDRSRHRTSYYCTACNKSFCTKPPRKCFYKHLSDGLPKKIKRQGLKRVAEN